MLHEPAIPDKIGCNSKTYIHLNTYTSLRDGIFAHPTLAEVLNTLLAQVG